MKFRGFTLIEVLLAVALLSIILAAVYSTFFLSHRAVEGMDEALLRLREVRAAMDIIKKEIDSIVYNTANEKTAFKVEDRDIYGKQASRITFTSFGSLLPGIALISYHVDERDKKLVVFKNVSSLSRMDEYKEAEFLEDIDSFDVQIKDNDRWLRTWDSSETKKVPEEIKISITFLIKNKQVSLHETIRPKIGKNI